MIWPANHPWMTHFGVATASGGSLAPAVYHSLGGSLAIYGERPQVSQAQGLPWLVFHGGPGGRINQSLVEPLRVSGCGWYGFDQRNSGLSEDLILQEIDLQLFVDDALAITRELGFKRINVLAGSWGATVALLLASQNSQLIDKLILRAPFLPFSERIERFFEMLENLAPQQYADVFGVGARTQQVCERLLNHEQPEAQAVAANLWRELEEVLLKVRSVESLSTSASVFQKNLIERVQLTRKYVLQSHFLRHDGFWSEADWRKDMLRLAQSNVSVTLLQGRDDQVCPPDGAALLHEVLPDSALKLLDGCGHLANEPAMANALREAVSECVA